MKRKILEPQDVPTQIKAWSLKGALKRKHDSKWTNKDYFSEMKNDICVITD